MRLGRQGASASGILGHFTASFFHLANKYLLSIYYVVSPDLGAGDSAANRKREGPFSNRIYRLTVIDDKGDLGLGLAPEGWRPELVYPNC